MDARRRFRSDDDVATPREENSGGNVEGFIDNIRWALRHSSPAVATEAVLRAIADEAIADRRMWSIDGTDPPPYSQDDDDQMTIGL